MKKTPLSPSSTILNKQTVEYIETMNQEWDLNPGHLSLIWLGFEPASPCSPTWYCQIPPPTLAPSEVLNGNTTDVLDVGEIITNQEPQP